MVVPAYDRGMGVSTFSSIGGRQLMIRSAHMKFFWVGIRLIQGLADDADIL